MPQALERQLKRQAAAKGLEGKRADAYVYGTMRKTGWVPSREKRNISDEEMEKKMRKHMRK